MGINVTVTVTQGPSINALPRTLPWTFANANLALAAAIAPAAITSTVDIDRLPFRPPSVGRQGWRIAYGPTVLAVPTPATAAAAAPRPAAEISLSSVTADTTTATAAAAAPVLSIDYRLDMANTAPTATTDTVGPAVTLTALPDVGAAAAAALAPSNLYVGEDRYPVYILGTATATADTPTPTVSISYPNTPGAATAAADAPSPALTVLNNQFPLILPITFRTNP
jgi:hypothetical protein